jgi:hypothetical protein
MDVVSQLAMNVTTYEGFYVYLKIIANNALKLYQQHHNDKQLINDICRGVPAQTLSNYIDGEDCDCMKNTCRILNDQTLPVMVHINVGLGSLVSYFQQLEDLCLHGVKRDLDDQLLTPNKRLKEFSNQLLNNY